MSAVIGNRHTAASNRLKAPITAAFVSAIRRFDPLAKVLYVSEGAVQLGAEPDYSAYHRVHSGEMGSVSDWIKDHPKEVAKWLSNVS